MCNIRPYDRFTIIFIITFGVDSAKNNLRVINGTSTDAYPFVVALLKVPANFKRLCTGSLIAPTWVLTAAHCHVCEKPEDYRVKYGQFTIHGNVTTQYKLVRRTIQHPHYIRKGLNFDISLFMIDRLESIKPVGLSAVDYTTLIGRRVRIMGFGKTKLKFKNSYKDEVMPLQTSEAVVMNCDYENSILGDYNKYGKICASSRCDKFSPPFFGDSGGPMLFKGKLIGATSSISYAIFSYTAVTPYLDWIKDIMNNFSGNNVRNAKSLIFENGSHVNVSH